MYETTTERDKIFIHLFYLIYIKIKREKKKIDKILSDLKNRFVRFELMVKSSGRV